MNDLAYYSYNVTERNKEVTASVFHLFPDGNIEYTINYSKNDL